MYGPSIGARARSGPSVLIVEDDPGTVETFAIALQREGYRVVSADSVADAIEVAPAFAVPDSFVQELVRSP